MHAIHHRCNRYNPVKADWIIIPIPLHSIRSIYPPNQSLRPHIQVELVAWGLVVGQCEEVADPAAKGAHQATSGDDVSSGHRKPNHSSNHLQANFQKIVTFTCLVSIWFYFMLFPRISSKIRALLTSILANLQLWTSCLVALSCLTNWTSYFIMLLTLTST